MLVLLAAVALAQNPVDPWGQWQTVTTEHYRLHYPVAAEAWAHRVAGQLEPIRERVSAEVGYAPEAVVDVVVMDPFRSANGFAIPLKTPRMGLFATPPPADPAFGWYRSWAEELVTHEDAHLVHMLRPSRNKLAHLVRGQLVGVGPITAKSPSWLIEGYATVIEGRLTELGRPNSDFRATLLRTWAQEGRLPAYGELDGTTTWAGGSVRYLIGSAYLEWLEGRRGQGSLRDLWRRMSARQDRSFEEAFEGVYGDDPASLYARFTAELAHDAIERERARPAVEGAAWLDRPRRTGTPAVSPDGERLAAVVFTENRPALLTVWKIDDGGEAEKEWQASIDEALEKDPEDVAPLRPESLSRSPDATRRRTARPPSDPRWTEGGLLFSTWTRDARGWYRPDLVLWDPDSGRERRVTRGEDIMSADPHPDGTWAVGVRSRWGVQELVRIDLHTGEVTGLSDPDPDTVWDHVRLHPDGDRFAVVRNQGGEWKVLVRGLDGSETVVDTPPGSYPTGPAWTEDGVLLLSLGQNGSFDLVADGVPITRARAGAFAPEPAGDGVFYLSMDGRGLDIRHLKTRDPVKPLADPGPDLVVRPPPPAPIAPPTPVPFEVGPYGLGRQELRPLVGAQASPTGGAVEPLLRGGDVVGRTSWLAVGSVGYGSGLGGGALAGSVRRLPVEMTLHGFAVEDVGWRAGGALRLSGQLQGHRGGLDLEGGGWSDLPLDDGRTPRRFVGWMGLQPHFRARYGRSWTRLDLGGTGRMGTTRRAWSAGEAEARLRLGFDDLSWGVGYDLRATTATDPLDRIRAGGLPSTLVPEAWQAPRVLVGALPATDERTQAYDHVRTELSASLVRLYTERHRLCDTLDCRGTWLLGVDTEVGTEAIGLGKVPGARLEGGVACLVAVPDQRPARHPCAATDPWTGWAAITWVP